MKVKSTNAYRTFYKEQYLGFNGIKNHKEHFVGSGLRLNSSKVKISGFFSFVHGDKDNISNFIRQYLDLAPDEQAVYEFLQNAYDARATQFGFLYDEEYLLVFNNGEKIDVSGIRSILNVGQTTKNEKSDIGKFGIGFKLAHRLLGESNGQKEIMDNAGPIIFSWNHYKDLKQFSEITSISDLKPAREDFQLNPSGKYFETKPYPWLFRILVTCFPAGINELFQDLKYEQHDNMPNPEELLILKKRISQYIVSSGHYKPEELNTGTIIFIKLGKDKLKKLIPENVKDTLGFSLNTLNSIAKNNRLKEIRLGMTKDDCIYASKELHSHVFHLPEKSPEYEKILSDAQSSERPETVEMVFLYPRNYDNFLTRHSNIYLYFPLSAENLNLNFILHCNCFHYQSSRTNIDRKNPRNIKIFEVFVEQLKSMLEDYRTNDFKKYTTLYAALILSEKSNTKKWAVDQIYVPILNYLSEHVPAKNGNCFPKSQIRIQDINLEVSPEAFGVQNYHWFYFDHPEVIKACKNKFRVKAVHLVQLIADSKDSNKINFWLNTHDNYEQRLLDEIEKQGSFLLSKNKNFINNFNQLKLFRNNSKRFLSLNELSIDPQAILLSEEYISIAPVLKTSALNVFEVSDKYKNIKAFIASLGFPHLTKTNKFLKYFCIKFVNINQSFDHNQIVTLLNFFKSENIPFFSELILKDENDEFFIIPRKNKRQQYFPGTKKLKLKAYLDCYHKETLIPLPEVFIKSYCKDENVLKKEELYEEILSIEENDRFLIDLIVESGYQDIQKRYLKRIKEFCLEVQQDYPANSFESKLLKLAMRLDDENLKLKTVLKNSNNDIVKLSSVVFSDRVIFKNKKEKDYILKLSEISPGYIESTDLVESIISSIKGIDEDKAKLYFKVGQEKERNEIFEELKICNEDFFENENNYLVANSHQLAFMLLYIESITTEPENDLVQFLVRTFDEKYSYYIFRKNTLVFYLPETSEMMFLPKENILANCYFELRKILHLSSKRPNFTVRNTEFRIAPYFKGNEFYLFPVKSGLFKGKKCQQQLFEYMYKKFNPKLFKGNKETTLIEYPDWKATSSDGDFINQFRECFERDEDATSYYLFGYCKFKALYLKKFAADNIFEQLPVWMDEFLNNAEDEEKKCAFLSALAINSTSSDIVKLRKALLNQKDKDYRPCNDKELIQKLIEPQRGYLSRTLQWIKEKNIQLITETEQFNLFINVLKPDYVSWPENNYVFIEHIDHNSTSYTFQDYSENTVVYLINKDTSLTNNDFKKILEQLTKNEKLCHHFVFEKKYDDLENQMQVEDLEVQYKLKPSEFIQEYSCDYYRIWKEDGAPFLIYEEPFELTISKFFHSIDLGEEKSGNEIFIQDDKIFFSKRILRKKDITLEKSLENIVDRNGFTQEHLNDLIEKKNNIGSEILKTIEKGDEDWRPESIDDVRKKNERHPIFSKNLGFEKTLLELLKLSKGKKAADWQGHIYHFTHVENAAKILNKSEILSRKAVEENNDFHNSAGNKYIENTKDDIKRFVRFYFRPKTPTQYYNEGLGNFTKKGDRPQCPVPIFFKFDLEEIMDQCNREYYVSNGNLLRYPTTQFGQSAEFLKSFDYNFLYHQFSECNSSDYMHASQQEFIIEDVFDFSNMQGVEVICPDEAARETLLELISPNAIDHERVIVDNSYYQHFNERVLISRRNGYLTASFPVRHESGYLTIERDFDGPKDSQVQRIEEKNLLIRFSEKNLSHVAIYYINREDERRSLVYERSYPA